jgi:predicted dehydrogenase
MKKVKYGIIGCGGLAQNQHIPNVWMSKNSELAVLCDLRKDVIEELDQYYQVGALETDHRKVLNNPEIDAVIIATREDTHVSLTLEALEAGKHVYVEKPLAETADTCRLVVEAEKKSGKLVAVGMNRRLAPAYVYVNDLLWKNGGPKNMFYRIADSYCLDWGKNYDGGMRIVHEVCHIFDILRYFAKSEVESVYAMGARVDDEQFCINFKSGAIATILSSGYVNSDLPKEHFEAIAERGAVTVEDFTEARRFSFEDGEDVKKFAGHFHPQKDMIHSPLLKELGVDGLYALRRASWQWQCDYEKLQEQGKTNSHEFKMLQQYVDKMPLRNYCVDKGWRQAVENLSDCILGVDELKTATPLDALQATNITMGAIESRKTGLPVKVE